MCGAPYLAALRGPLAEIPLIATGGINIDNAVAFIDAGATAVGIGGSMLDHDTLSKTGFEALERGLRTVCDQLSGPLSHRAATPVQRSSADTLSLARDAVTTERFS